MKKLFNSPSLVVDEYLSGLISSNPLLSLISKHRVVYRTDISTIKDKQVSLISGGGSGHEPAHVGYVGSGMLSAVVCGDVFASPSASQVFSAINQCASSMGVLLIVKNYTGDRLQFGKASERAMKELDIQVKMIVVGDDCAIPATKTKSVGRRGLAGTIFVHKIAGAVAKEGKSLMEVYEAAKFASENIGTVGIALSPCSLFGVTSNFQIEPDMMEIGLGIHGEKGLFTAKLTSSRQAVDICIDQIISVDCKHDKDKFKLGLRPFQDSVALMVNNLGSTTSLEMGILVSDATKNLWSRNIAVSRIYSGTFMTALEMTGFSISLMKVTPEILTALDLKVGASAWSYDPKTFERSLITLSLTIIGHSCQLPL